MSIQVCDLLSEIELINVGYILLRHISANERAANYGIMIVLVETLDLTFTIIVKLEVNTQIYTCT